MRKTFAMYSIQLEKDISILLIRREIDSLLLKQYKTKGFCSKNVVGFRLLCVDS